MRYARKKRRICAKICINVHWIYCISHNVSVKFWLQATTTYFLRLSNRRECRLSRNMALCWEKLLSTSHETIGEYLKNGRSSVFGSISCWDSPRCRFLILHSSEKPVFAPTIRSNFERIDCNRRGSCSSFSLRFSMSFVDCSSAARQSFSEGLEPGRRLLPNS